MRQLLVLVTSLLASALGLGIGFGGCPAKDAVKHFNVSRFLGQWYDVAHDVVALDFFDYKCGKVSVQSVGGNIHIRSSTVNLRTLVETTVDGSARQESSDDGKFNVQWSFRSPILQREYPPVPALILSTDYENYALIYSCVSFGLLSKESLVVLSRQPNKTNEAVQEKIEEALNTAGIKKKELQTTLQNCNETFKVVTQLLSSTPSYPLTSVTDPTGSTAETWAESTGSANI